MVKSKATTFRLLAITAALLSLALAACSSGDTADIVAAESSTLNGAAIPNSAREAISDLLGDIDAIEAVGTPNSILERIQGVSYDPAEPGVLASSVDAERNLLQIKNRESDGGRVSMKNGGAVRLREGLVMEIFVDPFPTNSLMAWIDIYLHDGAGSEFPDANVIISYDMLSMGHGPFLSTAEKSPGGHYTFRLDYLMFGSWTHHLEIHDPETDDEYRLEVIVVTVP